MSKNLRDVAPLAVALALVIAQLLACEVPAAPGEQPLGSGVDSVEAADDLVVVGTGRQEVEVREAMHLFEGAGLRLPPLEVHFSDDLDDCQGHYGLFQRHRTPFRIIVCSELSFVLPHELAHAWEAANLTDAQRADYMTARDLTTWNDPSTEWVQRAVEDLAFVIQQNLTASRPAPATPIWRERLAAYELATGRPSPLRGTSPSRHRCPAPPVGCDADLDMR